jgi:hypothetical protein
MKWLHWVFKSRISKIALSLLIEHLWRSISHGIMWHTKLRSIVEKNNVVKRLLIFFGSTMFSCYSLYDKALWAQTKKGIWITTSTISNPKNLKGKTLKNHRKHLNKYFHTIFLMSTFIRFHRF